MVPTGLATIFDWLSPVLVVFGVVVIALMLVIAIRSQAAVRGWESSASVTSDERRTRDVESMRDDLLETVRSLASQLENRVHELETLLEEADQRLALLNESLATTIGPHAAPSPGAPAPPAPPASPAAPAARAADWAPALASIEELDPLRRAIFDMADAGRTPLEIARALNEQVGKVELILALRQAT
jgi:DNA-directed RNA polymerase specialized sigma24 family protein